MLLKNSWPPEDPILSTNQRFHIIHGEDGVVLGTPACRALGIIDDQWPLSSLAENSLPRLLKHCKQPLNSPDLVAPYVHGQVHSITSNLESLPIPSDDDLLSNLNWMYHPADEVHPQVIGASSKPTITENSEDSDFSSILRTNEYIFDKTVLPAVSGEPFTIKPKPNVTPYAP